MSFSEFYVLIHCDVIYRASCIKARVIHDVLPEISASTESGWLKTDAGSRRSVRRH
nr:MAG TPA: hypothetical protein [Caudoviricetes sp.]